MVGGDWCRVLLVGYVGRACRGWLDAQLSLGSRATRTCLDARDGKRSNLQARVIMWPGDYVGAILAGLGIGMGFCWEI